MEHDAYLTTGWRSPSNIAIIKYWGKYANQIPANPSISFTLTNAFSETRVKAIPLREHGVSFQFLFEGKEKPGFAERIGKYLGVVHGLYPQLKQLHLEIESTNSFPHSSGIASSASAMSALALCLLDLQQQVSGKQFNNEDFLVRASELARLGSGSASRSVYGPVALWGKTHLVAGSSDQHAVPFQEVDAQFETFVDLILILDPGVKSVSSSAGHALMETHLYKEGRLSQVQNHLARLMPALRAGDLETFGEIAEAEALALHALMMTSVPSYILMKPATLEVIQRVRAYRQEHNVPVYFTLDAGPNVHLLFPQKIREALFPWIQSALLPLCADGRYLDDHAGSGPQRLAW